MSEPGNGRRRDWPLWEVFVRARRGLSHVHAGSLHAPDAEMALRNARDLYTRRSEGVSLWVVRASDIGRPRPTSATRSSTPPPTRSTATPRSTTSRRVWSTYERPAPRLHPRTGRRRLGLSPADGLVDQPRPELEEDVALANIGLDQLGQARMLLSYAGELEAEGRSEDELAYLRDDREFCNVKLVERPMTDFGVAMARLLVVATYQVHLYSALTASTDETLAAIAAKAVKEVAYHVDHASQWVLRLGDGTDESHARMQAALDAEWPYVDELFTPLAPSLAGRVTDPASLREAVLADLARVVTRATLTVPEVAPALGGGRAGLHTEHLGHLLAEMQHLHRSHPGATW